MKTSNKKVELLAPAGNFEKLEIAIHYGADAVYLAGKEFSLRNFSDNFTIDEIYKAVDLAHQNDVKVYVACNVYSRNDEQEAIANYLRQIGKIEPDAIIIADPAIIMAAHEIIPDIDIHLSTQSNTTNYNCVRFWEKLGVKRINLARELPLKDISEIIKQCATEIEVFIHGAMCISYSGRCLLSSFMVNRDSNRGLCSHPCRWRYSVVEEQRPGQYMPLAEDQRGAYIFNSKDLCMIEYIPKLIESGITSFKIEGRMKGINYLASVVKVYREAIDSYYTKNEYKVKEEWLDELTRINNRTYCTGFFLEDANQVKPNYKDNRPSTIHRFVGKVISNKSSENLTIGVRNKICKGDKVEIILKSGPVIKDQIFEITDKNGQALSAAQPNSEVYVVMSDKYEKNSLVRKAEDTSYKTNQ